MDFLEELLIINNLYTLNKIADGKNLDDKERIESSMRNVRRYKEKCLQLILNVANREFPGKY